MRAWGLRVCETCRGRGVVYRRERRYTCPDCGGARGGPSREAEQLRSVDVVRTCWKRLQAGETGELNLELAIRTALRSGLSLEQLHKRAGVPMCALRRGESGQMSL